MVLAIIFKIGISDLYNSGLPFPQWYWTVLRARLEEKVFVSCLSSLILLENIVPSMASQVTVLV